MVDTDWDFDMDAKWNEVRLKIHLMLTTLHGSGHAESGTMYKSCLIR